MAEDIQNDKPQEMQPEPKGNAEGSVPAHNEENVDRGADGYEKKEHTRSKMAVLFVLGYFAILFLCFVYAIMIDAPLNDLKDFLVGVAGALSGILGFIVGYYYKSSQDQ